MGGWRRKRAFSAAGPRSLAVGPCRRAHRWARWLCFHFRSSGGGDITLYRAGVPSATVGCGVAAKGTIRLHIDRGAVVILFFSATGNSGYVAKRIADGLGDECLDLFGRIREEDFSPHPPRERQARLGERLHPLHGVHQLLPQRGDRVR